MKKKLTIVIPVYFNELNLHPLMVELEKSILKEKELDFELIFVDDGSKDNSYSVLKEIAQKNSFVKIIKLSRNFGQHVAILAGLSRSTGDCATVISADLQDPPELILDMVKKWKEGNNVVLAVREQREDVTLFIKLYYFMLRKFALNNYPEGGFDFFLIDRKVIDVLNSIEEKNSSLMGQILWTGFKTVMIKYERKERKIGKSKWTFRKKVKLFIDSFTAFSYQPIKIISIIGFITAIIGFLAGFAILFRKLFFNIPVEGWASIMVVLLFLSGVQMLMLGVIGEYLWRNFDESRRRPVFIVEEEN